MRDNAGITYLNKELSMVTKKATPKKATTKKSTVSKSHKKATSVQSFRLARPQSPFFTIAITRQTLYWGIIAVAVLILGLWIIHLQNKVNEIYDAIDASAMDSSVVIPSKKSN